MGALVSLGSCAADSDSPGDAKASVDADIASATGTTASASKPRPGTARSYYVRIDGGDASECTGLVDAPLKDGGSDRACAWKHPYFALPPGGQPRMAADDTLFIGSGSYMIGRGADGAGDCEGRECIMAPVPSGAASTTRILGTNCSAPPTLWGSGGIERVLNLEGSSGVEIGCLEITDRHDCVYKHSNTDASCPSDGSGHWAKAGVFASRSRDVWLHDLQIHGLAQNGIHAGGLTNWLVERVRITANGRAGWNGNVGKASSNAGPMILRDIEIGWNGCGERWQTGEPWACWAQQTGGYGDGLGTAQTGGQWMVEDAHVHHNTSDGLDFRYMDGDANSSVMVRRLHATANAGNQVKMRGNATIENSVIVGHCGYFSGKHFMTGDDHCRAGGNAVQLVLTPGAIATVRHNTIAGEGGVLIGTGEGDDTARVEIQNNVLVGFPSFRKPGVLSSVYYANDAPAPVRWDGNLVWNVKNGKCPPRSICAQHPRLADMSLADFDPEPLRGSPVIDQVRAARGVTGDFRGTARPADGNADIGAIESRAR